MLCHLCQDHFWPALWLLNPSQTARWQMLLTRIQPPHRSKLLTDYSTLESIMPAIMHNKLTKAYITFHEQCPRGHA